MEIMDKIMESLIFTGGYVKPSLHPSPFAHTEE